MSKVMKLINTSEMTVPVEFDGGETVFLPPRGVVENADIANLKDLKNSVKVTYNLTEVGSADETEYAKKKKARLNG